MPPLREHARRIWDAAVAAADPTARVRDYLSLPDSLPRQALQRGGRVLVVGGGKAGVAMAQGVEEALGSVASGRLIGLLNVPPCDRSAEGGIRLHVARPAGSNHPTAEGVAGVEEQLALVAGARPGDVGLCLLSGGGSALLPAPVAGVSLHDKQEVTRLLHACGATIDEMNCVRKHLSRVKGGRLAEAFGDRHCPLVTLIVSDVIGDPLDVIASGPTAPDPTTFADALAVLGKFALQERVPLAVLAHLRKGAAGQVPDTLKGLPSGIENRVLCNNASSLAAAARAAEALGYRVVNLGSFLDGETRALAVALAGVVRSIRRDGVPASPPVCLLSGGETTVTLGPDHGKGGRNQEFVLAILHRLGAGELRDLVVLSGGTDGEDGPTDAAGAVGDAGTLTRAGERGLAPVSFLDRHDAYTFFAATGDLLRTGLTQTNVMDARVILVG
jgi:hydroxypyruvate reductase/glycerate 2-kinase